MLKVIERPTFDSDFGEQLPIMLAQLRGRRSYRSGGTGKAGHDVMHRDLAHVVVRVIRDELAFDDVRISHDLRRVIDRTDGDFGRLEERNVLGLRPLGDEAADDAVQLDCVLQALGIGRGTRVRDQLPAGRWIGTGARPSSDGGREASVLPSLPET